MYIYVIAILHNISGPCLVSRGGLFSPSISVDSMISVGRTRIGGANNIIVFIATVAVSIFIVQILSSSLSFSSLLLSGNASTIGSTVVIGYDDTSSDNADRDYNYWLPSLFPQVVIDIHVVVSLHSIVYSLLVSSDDISLSIVLALAPSKSLFQVQTCIYFVAILHIMFDPFWVLVRFAPGSFASLSCNPYLGSRGCVRYLLVQHLGLWKQGVNDTSNIDDKDSSRTILGNYRSIVGINISNGYDSNSVYSVTTNINTREINETDNRSIVLTSNVTVMSKSVRCYKQP